MMSFLFLDNDCDANDDDDYDEEDADVDVFPAQYHLLGCVVFWGHFFFFATNFFVYR